MAFWDDKDSQELSLMCTVFPTKIWNSLEVLKFISCPGILFQNRLSRLFCSLFKKVPYNIVQFSISNMVWSENVLYNKFNLEFNLGNLAIRKSHFKNWHKKNSWKPWSMKIKISFRKDSNPLCPLTPPSPSLVLHPKSKVWSLKRKEGRKKIPQVKP